MNPDPSILKKIKKLMSLAADPNNQHEAALAAAKAQEILLKHKLSLSDIEDMETATRNGIVEEDLNSPKGLRDIAQWKRILAATVCKNHFCALLTTPFGMRFIGSEEDIAISAWLYGYLSGQLIRLADSGWSDRRNMLKDTPLGKEHLKNKRAGVTWKNNFYIGAIHVLQERFSEMRQKVEREAVRQRREAARREAMEHLRKHGNVGFAALSRRFESPYESEVNALAPFVEAQKRVDDFVREKYEGNVDNPEGELDFKEDQDGYLNGARAGQRISLNKPLTGNMAPKSSIES